MSERRDIPGLWWLPSNPERQWTGKLRLAPKKSPRLSFTVPEGLYGNLPVIPELLHGCDEHGKPITLLHTSRNSQSMSGATARFKCSAGYALLGIHIAKPEEFKAHKLTLRVQYLFDWLNRTGFKRQETVKYESKIQHVLPDDLTFEVNPELKLKIASSSHYHFSHRLQSVKEDMAITFESASGFYISDCHELVSAVRHLLHFSILREVYPISLICNVDGVGMIEFISGSNRTEAPDEQSSDRWIFQFADVEKDFGMFFQKWLSFLKQFDEAVGCYFTTVYHSLPPAIEHLCLTQALEAYHGIKNQSLNHQDFVGKIQRLTETHRAAFSNVFPAAAEFAAIVRDNRNYYTHHNPKWLKDGRVVSRGDLYRLNVKLRILMQACILAELGLSAHSVSRLSRQLAFHVTEYA